MATQRPAKFFLSFFSDPLKFESEFQVGEREEAWNITLITSQLFNYLLPADNGDVLTVEQHH